MERERRKKLQGKSLAEGIEDDENAASWVQKMKHNQSSSVKKSPSRIKKPVVHQEYTADDLTGLKVAHGLEDVTETGETILVLKDSRIGEEEDGDGDNIELINVNLVDTERSRKNVDNQKKKTTYNPYDDEDQDEMMLVGKKPSILSHYDEQIDGPKKQSFVIGKKGKVDLKQERENKKLSLSEQLKSNTISLDYDKMQEVQDYYTQEEVSFKKSKKKKKFRQKELPEDIDLMETDSTPFAYSNVAKKINDTNFVDDDDLQNALARTRKLANRRKKKEINEEEEIARKTIEANEFEKLNAQDNDMELRDDGGSTIELSTTGEFVRNLAIMNAEQDVVDDTADGTESESVDRRNLNVPHEETSHHSRTSSNSSQQNEESKFVKISEEKANLSDGEIRDEEMGEGGHALLGVEDDGVHSEHHEEDETILEEEPLVSGGMAATLALLNRKNLLAHADDEILEKERKKKEKIKELASKSRYTSSRASKQDDISFDFQLVHTDDFGRKLNPKEAFKQLCHKFHGMKSGKGKTDKRLKKIKEDIMLKQASSTDTPMGTVSALQERTKSLGTAHIVLSKGNRAAALPKEIEEQVYGNGSLPLSKKPMVKPIGSTAVNSFQETSHQASFKPIPSQVVSIEKKNKITFGLNLKRTAPSSSNINSSVVDDHHGEGSFAKRRKL